MSCIKQTTKKYTTRPSPPYAANTPGCRGKIRVGNDGRKWASARVKGGVYRWTVVKSKKNTSNSSKTSEKREVKSKPGHVSLYTIPEWFPYSLGDFKAYKKIVKKFGGVHDGWEFNPNRVYYWWAYFHIKQGSSRIEARRRASACGRELRKLGFKATLNYSVKENSASNTSDETTVEDVFNASPKSKNTELYAFVPNR